MFRKQLGKHIATISDQALECMLRYHWPGNIRELKHVIERACVLCQNGILQLKHLPTDVQRPVMQQTEPASQPLHPGLHNSFPEPVRPGFQYQSEEEQLRNALLYANNKKAKAAKILGVSRSTLYRWMERYNIAE